MNMTHLKMDKDRLMVSGDLTFSTVNQLWKDSLSFLNAHQAIVIDFSEIKNSNSAGLALMIEWIKWAKEKNKVLKFTHIPANILAITKISGLEKIIS